MKIAEKKGIIQWFINHWNRSVDYDVDLEDNEAEIAYSTGILLSPNESDYDKVIADAITYWIVLYIIDKHEVKDG